MAKIAFPSPVNPDGRPETVSPWPCVDLAAHTRSRLTTATEEELCWACVIGEFSVSCSCHMWVGPGLQQVPWPHFFGLAGLAPGSICGKMNFGSRAAAAAFLACPDLVDSNSGPLNAPQGPVHRRFFSRPSLVVIAAPSVTGKILISPRVGSREKTADSSLPPTQWLQSCLTLARGLGFCGTNLKASWAATPQLLWN